MPLEIGQLVENRYRVAKLLGKGGMGSVYRAWDVRLDRPVALKEMIPQPGLEASLLEQLREQFEHEARILATLSHPSLVRVSDYFSWEANQYLVMDFVAGESLDERIQEQGPQAESNVIRWATQLLEALAYCHGRGVIHRDIKPQNIIVTPEGKAVLDDFGLVKLWNPSDPYTRTVMRGAGTPEYAPPEQYDIDWGHTDPRSDIYSLGATPYHAATGQTPPSATQRMANPSEFTPPRRINTALSGAVEAAILKAMEVPMDRRFQRAEEMSQALGLSVPPLAATPVTSPPGSTVVMPETRQKTAPRSPVPAPPRTQALPESREEKPAGSLPIWLVVAGVAVFCVVATLGGLFGVRVLRRLAERATGTPGTEETVTATVEVTPTVEVVRVAAGEDLAVVAEIAPAGATLQLAAGTYTLERPLDIGKPLRLVGAGMDQTVIVSEAEDHVLRFVGAGVFDAEDITFRHEGESPADVVVVEGKEAIFIRCRFTGAVSDGQYQYRAGLRIGGKTTGIVQECEASDNGGNGIQVEAEAWPLLSGNVCRSNTAYGIAYRGDAVGAARHNECSGNLSGIALWDSAHPELEKNVTAENKEVGIHYSGASGGTAQGNECSRNGLSGIIITGSAQPELQANTCTANEQSGIAYFETAGGIAAKNHTTENGLHGISVSGQAQPRLEGNVCTGNREVGIRYGDSTGGLALGNECSGNRLSGIVMVGEAQPTLEDNVCSNNTENGIAYFGQSGGTARGNTCTENMLQGIGVSEEAAPTLEGNTCNNNTEIGIRYSDKAAGVARNNECSGNTLSGIIVRAEAHPLLEENRCIGNQENGIAYFGTAEGTAKGNTCEENVMNGISASEQAQPTLEGNRCANNVQAGIAFFDKSGGSVQGNVLTGNKWGLFVHATTNPQIGDNDIRDNITDVDDRR